MEHQAIFDIAQLCAQKGIRDIVLCPGSRCAPLTLAFTRHPDLRTRTFSDERSAAFIAMGIAQQTRRTVVLVCTSGTAAYNFAPALAEAFFSNTPLLILTADRPAEYIHQNDGQTIYQPFMYGRHVKGYFQLPQAYNHADDHWAINRQINEAINLTTHGSPGPVHVNVPFREPLYPLPDEVVKYTHHVRIIEEVAGEPMLDTALVHSLRNEFTAYKKVLILVGQTADPSWAESIHPLATRAHIPVLGEILSNQSSLPNLISPCDLILSRTGIDKALLKPDLLISIGGSVLSKNLKNFIRSHYPAAHWHVQASGHVADTFQHLTRIIRATPESFFAAVGSSQEGERDSAYLNQWLTAEAQVKQAVQDFFPASEYGEFELVQSVLNRCPEDSSLHLANSMSVRYANLLGLPPKSKIRVYSNRGTSGIDGCTSTAVGHCLSNPGLHVVITGDLAFFYDRNAFWHNYPINNLRVILLNNHGGIIFKMIDGPSALPESDEYFVTRQKSNAKQVCAEFGLEYHSVSTRGEAEKVLSGFFQSGSTPRLLELETSVAVNEMIFRNFKKKISSL